MDLGHRVNDGSVVRWESEGPWGRMVSLPNVGSPTDSSFRLGLHFALSGRQTLSTEDFAHPWPPQGKT